MQMMKENDLVITCLPSPAASAAVMEAEDGILAGMSEGQIWAAQLSGPSNFKDLPLFLNFFKRVELSLATSRTSSKLLCFS